MPLYSTLFHLSGECPKPAFGHRMSTFLGDSAGSKNFNPTIRGHDLAAFGEMLRREAFEAPRWQGRFREIAGIVLDER